MNSNKRINLLVDMVKLGLIILIACAMVSVIVFMVSDDPMTAITSFFYWAIYLPAKDWKYH